MSKLFRFSFNYLGRFRFQTGDSFAWKWRNGEPAYRYWDYNIFNMQKMNVIWRLFDEILTEFERWVFGKTARKFLFYWFWGFPPMKSILSLVWVIGKKTDMHTFSGRSILLSTCLHHRDNWKENSSIDINFPVKKLLIFVTTTSNNNENKN